MGKVYQTRTSFALDVLRQSGTLKEKTVLDVGFIGEDQEATVHYSIVDSVGGAGRVIGIDTDEEKLIRFLGNEKSRARQKNTI